MTRKTYNPTEPRDKRGRWTRVADVQSTKSNETQEFLRDMEYGRSIGALRAADYHDLQKFLADPQRAPSDERQFHDELKSAIHEAEERNRPLPARLQEPVNYEAWLRRNPDFSNHWLNSLTPDERQAIGQYKGTMYTDLNGISLNGDAWTPQFQVAGAEKEWPGITKKNQDWLRHQDVLVDQAIAKAPLPERAVVYRGMSFDRNIPTRQTPSIFANLKPGQTVHWNSYLSTSWSPETARGYAGYDRDGYFWEIHVPKGYPAAPTDVLTMDRIAGSEQELTLPRDTRLYIHKVYHDAYEPGGPKGWHVVAEVVPPGKAVIKSYDPAEPRDKRGRWTNETDLEDILEDTLLNWKPGFKPGDLTAQDNHTYFDYTAATRTLNWDTYTDDENRKIYGVTYPPLTDEQQRRLANKVSQKKEPPKATASIAWQPSMSPEEAKQWSADSARPGLFYRSVAPYQVSSIEKYGVRPSTRYVYGPGVYLASDVDTAEFYRTLKLRDFDSGKIEGATDDGIIAFRVRVKNPLVVDSRYIGTTYGQAAARAVLERIPGLENKFFYNPGGKDWEKTLREHGYDAVEIRNPWIDPAVGGNQLIVLDPKAVTMVRGSFRPDAESFAKDVQKSYNPDEPRDRRGRWTKDGSRLMTRAEAAKEEVDRQAQVRKIENDYAPRINRLLGVKRFYPLDRQEFLHAYNALDEEQRRAVDKVVDEQNAKIRPLLPPASWDRAGATLTGIHFSGHTLSETDPLQQGSGQAGQERRRFVNGRDVRAGMTEGYVPYTNFYLDDAYSPIEDRFLGEIAHVSEPIAKEKIWDSRQGRVPYDQLQRWGYQGVYYPDGNQLHMFVPVKVRAVGRVRVPQVGPQKPLITGDLVRELAA